MSVAISTTVVPSIPATIEQLLSSENRGSFELVDGKLQEVHMSNFSTYVIAKLIGRMLAYCEAHRVGQVLGSEGYYRCFGPQGTNVRKPDISFISSARLPEHWIDDNYFTIPPDLAVEVLSPNDLATDVNRKIKEYLAAGVRLIWVIDPLVREVMIHRVNGTIERRQETDELLGEEVLPEFRCSVQDLLTVK